MPSPGFRPNTTCNNGSSEIDQAHPSVLKNRGEGSGDARALEVRRHHISPPNTPTVAVAAAAPSTHIIFVFRFELADWRGSSKFVLMVALLLLLSSWR
jgi:hypothetical protein